LRNSYLPLTGTAQNCEGNGVANGYAILRGIPAGVSEVVPLNSDGSFSATFVNCGADDISVRTSDLDEGTQSEELILPIDGGNINAGIIDACDEEIEVGVTFIMDNGMIEETFTPAVAAISSVGGGLAYQINFKAPGETTGEVEYNFTLVDWNNNPADPLYALSYEITLLDGGWWICYRF